jgi:hypothetical protein
MAIICLRGLTRILVADLMFRARAPKEGATISYRILSLDGGGTWALIEVKALMRIGGYSKDTLGHTVLKDLRYQFNLIFVPAGGQG